MSKFEHISVEQAQALLNERDNVMLLDMREARDYCQGHDPHAIHLQDHTLHTLLKHTPRQVHMIICCYHGNASKDMARLFSEFGFLNCYSLEGGYEAWKNRKGKYRQRARLERNQDALPA